MSKNANSLLKNPANFDTPPVPLRGTSATFAQPFLGQLNDYTALIHAKGWVSSVSLWLGSFANLDWFIDFELNF